MAFTAEQHREIRQERAAARLCGRCGKRPVTVGPQGGATQCDECREEYRIAQQRRRDRIAAGILPAGFYRAVVESEVAQMLRFGLGIVPGSLRLLDAGETVSLGLGYQGRPWHVLEGELKPCTSDDFHLFVSRIVQPTSVAMLILLQVAMLLGCKAPPASEAPPQFVVTETVPNEVQPQSLPAAPVVPFTPTPDPISSLAEKYLYPYPPNPVEPVDVGRRNCPGGVCPMQNGGTPQTKAYRFRLFRRW